MKHSVLYLCAAILLLASCGNKGYKVTVTFPDGTANGDTAYLTDYDSGDTLMAAVVQNNICTLEGETEEPFFARVLVGSGRYGFIVEPGDITLNIGEGTATGSLNDKMATWSKDMELIANDSTLTDAQSDSIYADGLMKLCHENLDNAIGKWAFTNYLAYRDFSEAEIDAMLKEMPAGYATLKRVDKAKQAARQVLLTAEGKKFTDFQVKGADGKVMKLSDYAGKGRVVVVDFWASWCPPCRAEIPKLQALKAEYGDKFDVLGVAVWDAPADTRRAIDELGITWPVIMGNENLTEPTDIYGIKSIPHVIIIGADSTILSRNLLGDELKAKLLEVIRQPQSLQRD